MKPSSLIVLGASAGGLEPLKRLVQGLPTGLPAAILVVLHTSPQSSGLLAEVLGRSTPLPTAFPVPTATLQAGAIYVAPPDHHLMVADGQVSTVRGPRENGFRPAIDPLFRSAARAYGKNVIGVILSGALDDGSFGLRAIKEAGGIAIVQHPEEAMVTSMPLSAIQRVQVDYIRPVAEIPQLLVELTHSLRQLDSTPVQADAFQGNGSGAPTMPKNTGTIHSGPGGTLKPIAPDKLEGPPSSYTCPDCGGTLWELQEGQSFRFRCHTGHGYTPDSLLEGQSVELEHALWSAVRVLKERAGIHDQMATRMQSGGLTDLATRYQERATQERNKSQLIEGILSQTKRG